MGLDRCGGLQFFLGGLLAILAAGGCSRPVPESPPIGLRFLATAEISRFRAEKDEEFRTDPNSPIPPELRSTFRGLEYFPVEETLRFAVRLRRYPQPVPLTIVTTAGVPRPAQKAGYVEFPWQGELRRLQVYLLLDAPPEAAGELFLPFLDQTSGKETYASGRYVELAPGGNDWYVLDFNLAYHPLCAYGRTIYRCPRTPEENRLPFPVCAGERGPGRHGPAEGAANPAASAVGGR